MFGTGTVGAIGVSQVLFGSDFPHAEGLPEPLDFVSRIEGLSEDEVRQVMRENGARLLGIC